VSVPDIDQVSSWDSARQQLREAAKTLWVDSVTASVVTAFGAQGIRVLLLKGPTIANWIYADGGRSYGDTDLLVSPNDFTLAENILESAGFRYLQLLDSPSARPWHAHTWVRNSDGAVVDLHRTVVGALRDPKDVWFALTRDTETMTISGTPVEVLSRPTRALLVALHAAQHGRGEAQPLRDLERALSKADADIWRRARTMATDIGGEEALAAGLSLTEAGDRLRRALRLGPVRSVEIAIRADGPTDMALGFEWLASRPTAREKASFVLHELFPPPDFMRAWIGIASRGHFGLILSYLWRPLWLVSHSWSGLRAYRRAKHSTRS
jgi:hypothetical protein